MPIQITTWVPRHVVRRVEQLALDLDCQADELYSIYIMDAVIPNDDKDLLGLGKQLLPLYRHGARNPGPLTTASMNIVSPHPKKGKPPNDPN